MNMIIKIKGVEYLPLRAIPFITGGAISDVDISHMIYDPDSWCDAEYDQVVSPYKYQDSEILLPLSRSGFIRLARLNSNRKRGLINRLPAGILVKKDSILEKYEITTTHSWVNNPKIAILGGGEWNIAPSLSSTDKQFVFDGLPIPMPSVSAGLPTSKLKGKAEILNKISRFIDDVEQFLKPHGIVLSRNHMPGVKKDWITLIEKTLKIFKSTETFHDYFSEIDLKWPQGLRPENKKDFEIILPYLKSYSFPSSN